MTKNDTCFAPAWEIADRVARQDLQASDVLEAIIERIERINPRLNAYCIKTYDLAREQAREADTRAKASSGTPLPPLNGVPASIKDMFDIAGHRTTWGSLIHEHDVAPCDDIVIERFRASGAVFVGKTNMCEFGALGVTKNFIFGETGNPWNFQRTCGGSSGGAAAAVAAGLGPVALGADGGGSIRHPATFCGCFGFKGTFGLVPFKPLKPKMAADSLTHVGPITRDVRDAAIMLDAIKGMHPLDRYSVPSPVPSFAAILDGEPARKPRIGWTTNLGWTKAIDPDVEKAVASSVVKFQEIGWHVEEITVKIKNPEPAFYVLWTNTFGYDMIPRIKDWGDKMDPDVVRMAGSFPPANDFIKATAQRNAFNDAIMGLYKEHDLDLLVTPTAAVPAFELGRMFPPTIAGKAVSPTGWMPFTFPFNLTSQPAASLPCGFSGDGLPIGMQVVGKRFDDALVFQASKAFETLQPWANRRPQLDG